MGFEMNCRLDDGDRFCGEPYFMEILCGKKPITSKNNSIFACKCGTWGSFCFEAIVEVKPHCTFLIF